MIFEDQPTPETGPVNYREHLCVPVSNLELVLSLVSAAGSVGLGELGQLLYHHPAPWEIIKMI